MLIIVHSYPRSRFPGRIHLLWIVRHEQELTWLANLAHKTLTELRRANRPDRLHLQFYVTSNRQPKLENNTGLNPLTHMVVINEKGCFTNILKHDEEKMTLLTPNLKRNAFKTNNIVEDNNFDIVKEYPLLGCRVKRGRPHWDRVFGYWVHLYPK